MPATTTTQSLLDAVNTLTRNVDRVTATVETLSRDVTTVSTRQSALETSLPDDYLSQREAAALIGRNHDEHSSLDRRLIALEEWRLAQTRAEGERLAALQAQIQAAVLTAKSDLQGAALTATKEDNATRDTMNNHRALADARTISFTNVLLSMLGSALLYYILGHLHP